jgi:hypothetical protein
MRVYLSLLMWFTLGLIAFGCPSAYVLGGETGLLKAINGNLGYVFALVGYLGLIVLSIGTLMLPALVFMELGGTGKEGDPVILYPGSPKDYVKSFRYMPFLSMALTYFMVGLSLDWPTVNGVMLMGAGLLHMMFVMVLDKLIRSYFTAGLTF